MHRKDLYIWLLVLFPVLLAGFAFLITSVPLPHPLPSPGSHARNLPAAILTGILGFFWVVCLMTTVINSHLNRGRALDGIFTSRGLAASSYLLTGRQYNGQLNGRRVEIQYSPARTLQNSLLNMRINLDNDQRAAFGRSRPLLDCSDCPAVEHAFPGGSDLQVFCKDETWARQFLSSMGTADLINNLMDDSNGLGLREIYLQPGTIWLRARPTGRVTTTDIEGWLDDLLNLTGVVETSRLNF